MWPDNETEIDFLNFTSISDTVAEIIVQASGRPVSIGVSGAWGVGKSSMIKLIRSSLKKREKSPTKYLFVEFNAWLYQGYDDVRAALLEIIANALKAEAIASKTTIEKASELAERVDWFRFGKLAAGAAGSLFFGLPPTGLIGEAIRFGATLVSGHVDGKTLKEGGELVEKAVKEGKEIIRPKSEASPPQAIHDIRQLFEETLEELGVTLVVLIDDLDRCLPETTISTLEAIRLFLFLKNTAFVIAADNDMIKHAVRKHFDGVDDKHVTSYFDKLIQVPIRVPPLGTQEVRAYMMLLFIESSPLSKEEKETVRSAVCKQLSASWQGKRVDRTFMKSLGIQFSNELVAKFDAADRLAPLMATASQIEGNPRLIKRFLNALQIRMAIAHAHGISVDEAVLAKILLFERCGEAEAYKELSKAVSTDEGGQPSFLQAWEEDVANGKKPTLKNNWDSDFVREWLAVRPLLGQQDLRGALYVSREHAPVITPSERLSSDGAELLSALLNTPDMAAALGDKLKSLPKSELAYCLDRLLDGAPQIQEWGVPPLLEALLAVTRADPSQGARLAAFLEKRPGQQINASLVPKIQNEPWADQLYRALNANTSVSKPVKAAIKKVRPNGNI